MATKEQKERFFVLLEQLKMTSDEWMPYFRDAFIRKVVIDKEEKSWHFYFQFANVLPAEVYKSFTDRLAAAFRHIAAIRYTIDVESPRVTEDDVRAYWPLCLAELQEGVSPLVDLLSRQTPAVKGNKLVVTARHEAEALAVKRRFAQKSPRFTRRSVFRRFSWKSTCNRLSRKWSSFWRKSSKKMKSGRWRC